MDFARALDLLTDFADRRAFPFAVIGGVCMAAYGDPRTTLDLDIVVPGEAQDDLVKYLQSLGYETLHQSSGYSNHLHPDPDWGRIDVVYVRGQTRDELFSNVRMVDGPDSTRVAVPRPEHLVAMKVFAMKNDPSRTFHELADIRYLLTLPDVNRDEARAYFSKHGMESRYAELEQTF